MLKSVIRKHVAKFGSQWDKYLAGVLWAYRNTPHEATQEKPSFLLFGIDCKSPTAATLLPPEPLEPAEVSDYRQELVLSLSSARTLAANSIKKAQRRYKAQYDKKTRPVHHRVGDWVLVRFPHEESGKQRKLSRPWHSPYRVTQRDDPDITVVKVHFPEEGAIQVHQSRVCSCPSKLPAGFYWYGGQRKSPGRLPPWLAKLLSEEKEVPDQTEDIVGSIAESEHADIELCLSENEDEPVDELSAEPVGEPSTESPPAMCHRYSLRNRDGGVQPPKRLM